MNKILLLMPFLWLNFSLVAQEVIIEKQIYESANHSKLYRPDGDPPMADLGEKGFVIKVDDKVIVYDNELNKKLEMPRKVHRKTVKGYYSEVDIFLASKSTAYDIMEYRDIRHGRPDEISIAAYSVEDGKVTENNITLSSDNGTTIGKFFTLSDGLYFFKVSIDKKAKSITHSLGKVDVAAGKVTEKKINLPYNAEEINDVVPSIYGDETVYTVYSVENNVIRLIKSIQNPKTGQLTITLGSIDMEGNYSQLVKTEMQRPETMQGFTLPVATADTVNRFIYVSGYLIGHTGFKGIYYRSYSLENGKQIADKTLFFDKINADLKLVRPLDENIMFAETGLSDGAYLYYKISLRPDIYNNLVQVTLVRRYDAVLTNGYNYLYLNPEGKVTDIVRVLFKKPVERFELYSDRTRKIKTAVDFYEARYPVDKKQISVNYIFQKDYMILLDGREYKSQVNAYKLKVQ